MVECLDADDAFALPDLASNETAFPRRPADQTPVRANAPDPRPPFGTSSRMPSDETGSNITPHLKLSPTEQLRFKSESTCGPDRPPPLYVDQLADVASKEPRPAPREAGAMVVAEQAV